MTGGGEDTRNDAARNAEFPLDALAEMARTLAHDLNQPLAAAANYLAAGRSLARRQAPDVQALGEALEKAAIQVSRASAAVRRMRLFLAPEEPELTKQSLHELIRRACAGLENENRKFDLRLIAAEDVVLVDAAQIRNALETASEAVGLGVAQTLTTYSDGRVIRTEIAAALLGDDTRPADGRSGKKTLEWALASRVLETHFGKIQQEDALNGPMVRLTLPLAQAHSG